MNKIKLIICVLSYIFLVNLQNSHALEEPNEAYFNSTAYLRLLTPMPLWSHSAISFRSCLGGEILSQQYSGHTLLLSVTIDTIKVALITPSDRVDVRVPARLLDNQWHTIHFIFQLGNLYLQFDWQSVIIANSTFNSLLLSDQEIKNEAAVLILGNTFSGCLQHGPGLVFNTKTMRAQSVIFGPCPLANEPCTGHDVLIHPTVNHCLHEPCMQHGTCFSGPEKYECHCTARYTGKNCEIDLGPPCKTIPCQNGGSCVEDNRGNFRCFCAKGFNGKLCENEVVMHPLCENNPCQNNGTCKVKTNSNTIECECEDGFTGTRCETDKNDCESSPCFNGGECVDEISGFLCNCAGTGYSGTLCQNNIDECLNSPCLNNGKCYDTYGSYICECAVGYGGPNCETILNECQSQPCQQGGTCVDIKGGFKCNCPPGFTGVFCEIAPPCPPCPIDSECIGGQCVCKSGTTGTNCSDDIDECKQDADICGHGICVNHPGTFKCYCEPGFTGRLCDLDVDECLSLPCKNGGLCKNEVNDYECICPPGYNGKDCGNDINECAGSPCLNGSTCKDLIANFTCICVPGMTGRLCEIDIDDCVSTPCLNNGHCIDKLGGYTCDCSGTGYSGGNCENNIDECLSNPCENNAKCTDKVNDYQCECYSGYTGKNCEIDIDECESNPCLYDGICLQRSNITLYNMPENITSILPPIFSEPFSYYNASGYECICVKGVTGKNCEININDCEPNPCSKNGNCVDGIGMYTCECESGFTGIHCEIDIDECDLYKPCIHGTCIDARDNYLCDCDNLYGGKNCSVSLTGCLDSPCLNDGTCIPYLENETQHKFNCSCNHGFQGSTCEKITTMSLVASSLLTVNTTRDEGYEIHLRFKTTLPNGILAFGNANAYSYILELVNGRLNLHSSLLNKWEGVFIGSGLNDSKWQKVFVAINSSHLVLSANEEQTIYPINSYEGTNASHTSFPVTYLGGTIPNLRSYLRHLTHAPSSFVGCMEDVVINGQWVFAFETDPYITLTNVETGCPRTPQCDPNPCHSNGQCSDLWHTFSCACQRPHLGKTCKYNITAATFGNENTTHSAVVVKVNDISRRSIRSVLDISMFIRTRQSSGQVFYLGSYPRQNNTGMMDGKRDSYVSAKLHGGELLVKIQFNGTVEAYPVGGNKLDNGYIHFIQVIRNLTLVEVKLNGTEYFRKTLSSTGQLDAQVLYLGGPPPFLTGNEIPLSKEEEDLQYFKGIIQDVQVSNGTDAMMVEIYPLNEEGLELPPPLGKVTFDNTSILKGEVSDDLCRTQPCSHNASCKNTWNDFVCLCPRGYKGRYCQEIQFCELYKCPGNSICQNLDNGFECITNITFQGNELEPISFTFVPIDTHLLEPAKLIHSIEISYRTKIGGPLLYVQDDDMFFEIIAEKEEVTIQWRLSTDILESSKFGNETSEYDWATIYIQIENGKLEAGWKGWDAVVEPLPGVSKAIDQNAYAHLFSGKFPIYLGGVPQIIPNDILKRPNITKMYRGCLGETRIDGYLLPFYPYNEFYSDNLVQRSHFDLNSTKPIEGCVVCFESDCQNNGTCTNPSGQYACDCPAGYTRDDCSENINECLENLCTNNSTCIDGIASYTCDCLPGYEGDYCETDINECDSNPCHNGGQCIDRIAAFECNCTEEYAGNQCDILKLVTCENNPCKIGSTCVNGFNATTGNNFTCYCMEGLSGYLCDIPFCSAEPCQNGGYCVTKESMSPFCQCQLGFTGRLCVTQINECDSNPCQNKGVCTDHIGSYSCDCSNTGFEGVNCEIDIDECMTGQHNCGGGGFCVNTKGSFKCQCPNFKCGVNCNISDPCLLETPCQNEGVCIEMCTTKPDYKCECAEGFIGKNCTNLAALKDEEYSSSTNILIITIPIVIGLLIICGALVAAFLIMARNKRATRGTYSPSAQEYCNPRLEMDNVLKPPPEERLI